jgi:hypothetical protein
MAAAAVRAYLGDVKTPIVQETRRAGQIKR